MPVKMRCLIAEASPYWEYNRGQIYDIPDDKVEMLLALKKFERADNRCPHCGGALGEIAEETAAMGGMPEVAVMPRAHKR